MTKTIFATHAKKNGMKQNCFKLLWSRTEWNTTQIALLRMEKRQKVPFREAEWNETLNMIMKMTMTVTLGVELGE